MKMRVLAVSVLLLTLLAGSGCSVFGTPRAALDGTEWVLVSWAASPPDPTGFRITAAFADGRVGGSSGVNSYGASYRTGLGGRFAVGEVSSTLMAGPEPAMRAEAAYLDLLKKARGYVLGEERLALVDGDGNELLVFAPAR